MECDGGAPLFEAIGSFLSQCRAEARQTACREYWQYRPQVTRTEISMLAWLGPDGRCADAVAAMLSCSSCDARRLLDAMAAIGMVECCSGSYRATEAALTYCRTVEARSFGPDR